MQNLILIRHGETPWTLRKCFQGHTDTQLTPHGKAEIRRLAKRLKKVEVDAIYGSPLLRARESAEIISSAMGKKIQVDPRLKEIHFGDWEGKSAQELVHAKDPDFKKWCEGRYVDPPKGETLAHFRKRLAGFLKNVLAKHKHKDILVVTHGGPIRMLIYEALKLPALSFWTLRIDTASISVLRFHPHLAQLALCNDISHHEKGRLLIR